MEKFMQLPQMTFTISANEKGDTKQVQLPKHGYMKLDP